jgi:hypothetical protein
LFQKLKNALYPTKMGTKHEKGELGDAPQTMYQWSRSLEIVSGTEKCALYLMKICRKHEKYEFWGRHSNHVSVVMIARYCVGNRKMRAIDACKMHT